MSDKLRVLFVDDDESILTALRRSMHRYADRCESLFAVSAQDGLKLMEAGPVDVVVSDMRMPHMDGADFLNTVRDKYPATVRIILSGYAAQESVMRTVGPAHLYLAKPCSPEVLLSAITRPLALRKLLSSPQLRSLLSGLTTLPSLPEMYLALEHEFHSNNGSAQSVANIISGDMAMTAELLKLTNSAYFAASGRVSTPLQAVRILGFETVQSLVLRIGIFRQFSTSGKTIEIMRSLDTYSVHMGMMTKALAQSEGVDDNTVSMSYCVGLLSSIGCLVLLDSYPDRMMKVLKRVESEDITLDNAEREEFGACHEVVGAYLLGLWGFADPIVEAIAFVSAPSKSLVRDNIYLTTLHAATILGPSFPPVARQNLVPFEWDMEYLRAAGRSGHLSAWTEVSDKLKAEWDHG